MKALSILKSAIDQSSFVGIIALVLLAPVLFPGFIAQAAELQTQGQPAQVFEIKITDPALLDQLSQTPKSNETQNSITYSDVQQSDPLVVNLQNYLQTMRSPLAPNAAQLVSYPHWQLALSISLVESHMCEFTPEVKTKSGWAESHNCSGIEGGNSYRVYASYLDWFADMNSLLSQPNYVNRPIDKFIGYYVYPGSANWLYGVKKTKSDLATLEQVAQTQRVQMAQATATTTVSNQQLATIAQ